MDGYYTSTIKERPAMAMAYMAQYGHFPKTEGECKQAAMLAFAPDTFVRSASHTKEASAKQAGNLGVIPGAVMGAGGGAGVGSMAGLAAELMLREKGKRHLLRSMLLGGGIGAAAGAPYGAIIGANTNAALGGNAVPGQVTISGGASGLVGGAGIGAFLTAMSDAKKKKYLRNMLLGGAIGGAGGLASGVIKESASTEEKALMHGLLGAVTGGTMGALTTNILSVQKKKNYLKNVLMGAGFGAVGGIGGGLMSGKSDLAPGALIGGGLAGLIQPGLQLTMAQDARKKHYLRNILIGAGMLPAAGLAGGLLAAPGMALVDRMGG